MPTTDETLLHDLQRAAFGYFTERVNEANGLVADTSREGSPASIAVMGFALSAYPVGVERGWMTREDALSRSLAALRFLSKSDQSGTPEATGYKGFYYHFLDLGTGTRAWKSELSMIDTALLISGALLSAAYFTADAPEEAELRELVTSLYQRIDWRWAQAESPTIKLGWKPESGFLNYAWEGYNEALVLYVLALGSPTCSLAPEGYEAWTATYQWENLYGQDLLYAGPLFVHQFSHAWLDFREIRDRFMREKRCDYFENSRRATQVQREYARRNPRGFQGYHEDCWGFTACDGPSGYAARGIPFGPDDGTLAGWAPIASLPFAPDLALAAVRGMRKQYPEMMTGMRCASSFNPSVPGPDGRPWVSPGSFGLDQGIVVLMIENHLTGLPWRLMRECPHIGNGLRRASFKGGWL